VPRSDVTPGVTKAPPRRSVAHKISDGGRSGSSRSGQVSPAKDGPLSPTVLKGQFLFVNQFFMTEPIPQDRNQSVSVARVAFLNQSGISVEGNRLISQTIAPVVRQPNLRNVTREERILPLIPSSTQADTDYFLDLDHQWKNRIMDDKTNKVQDAD
jgi:hypothetical protein